MHVYAIPFIYTDIKFDVLVQLKNTLNFMTLLTA